MSHPFCLPKFRYTSLSLGICTSCPSPCCLLYCPAWTISQGSWEQKISQMERAGHEASWSLLALCYHPIASSHICRCLPHSLTILKGCSVGFNHVWYEHMYQEEEHFTLTQTGNISNAMYSHISKHVWSGGFRGETKAKEPFMAMHDGLSTFVSSSWVLAPALRW